MRKYTTLILLLTAIVSHAQHSFFRGNNNYVAPIEVPIVATGGVSNGLDFDGINDYVENTSFVITPSLGFTIEGWIKVNDLGFSAMATQTINNYPAPFDMYVVDGSGKVSFLIGQGNVTGNIQSTTALTIGNWTHLAFVYDPAIAKVIIYINGVQDGIGNATSPGNVGGSKFIIGNRYDNITGLNGTLDDVRIWNVARSQAEIQANMNTELAGTESGLVAYYPFNQGIASGNNTAITTVTDKTANALNGTLYNFAKTGATSNFVVGKVSGSIVANGLVLNLDASNSSSYSGTGTTWTDLSGSGNNGILTNGATFSSTAGGTLVFDGIDDRVQTSYNPTFTDFTVCVWYKDNGSSTYGRLVDNNYINGFWIGKNATTPNQWGGGIKESPYPYGIYLTLQDSQWHFLTSVRSGTTHTIYGDGITNKISNTVSAAALNGTSISIGEWSGGGTGQIFKGNIPQVLIYNRALTDAEIMQIFNATKGKYGL